MKDMEINNMVFSHQEKRGMLEKLTTLCPLGMLNAIGVFCQKVVEPSKYGYLQCQRYSHFVEESQWWSKEKLEAYQMERLQLLLEHAYKNVPYYQEIFRQRGLTPKDFRSMKDLCKLPVLSKEDVRKNFNRLIARNIPLKQLKGRIMLSHTSGSTGQPMYIYRDYAYGFMNLPLYSLQFKWADIKLENRNVRLVSRPFIYDKTRSFYIYEPYYMRLTLSVIDLGRNTLDEYLDLIKKFKPVYCAGVPSAFYALALYARERKRNDIHFKVFFAWCENLYDFQKKIIEEQFYCKVFNYYSSEEYLIFAVDCNFHEGLHIETRKGIMEIVGSDGEALPNGRAGRIICTGFNNDIMPLIRYDIGDIGAISTQLCSCGRGLPLLKSLDGRTSEYIEIKDKYISPVALSVVLERLHNIKECQFVQESADEIRVNIVKKKNYSSEDNGRLIKLLKHVIGDEVKFDINFVDAIPRTTMGKYQFVINRLV